MIYSVRFSGLSKKQFAAIGDAKLKERITAALEYIGSQPLEGKPLQGELKGTRSFRAGDYRIVYSFDKNKGFIGVLRIGHRGNVYRGK